MEFPGAPYDAVPINGFEYPTVADIEAHVEERGASDHNLMRMWLPDQIWTQNRIERTRGGYAQNWPAWANSLINNSYRPDGSTMTGGRAFQGAVLLTNENRRHFDARIEALDQR